MFYRNMSGLVLSSSPLVRGDYPCHFRICDDILLTASMLAASVAACLVVISTQGSLGP
jgi:hypothetical protein